MLVAFLMIGGEVADNWRRGVTAHTGGYVEVMALG